MWVLILTLQFFVFIAVWNIRFPKITRFLLHELRKISLGEFIDDLEVSTRIPAFFGIESEVSSGADEKVGEDRLGSKDGIFSNFGAAMILASSVLVMIVILITLSYFLVRRANCSSKCAARLKQLREKVFWNPLIRYVYLNALKLNVASLVVIKAQGAAIGAIATIAVLNIAVVFFVHTLIKNRE
mmetsp:Transcript_1153/g.1718  ORF Transcript_1153/g.1718 Transcript_1153/m.1718 type:complete len:185 (+) Transcript_1153:2442-2996(+)